MHEDAGKLFTWPDPEVDALSHLRPLLVELGASVPTRGVYHLTSQMDALEAIAGDWGKTHETILRAAISGRAS